MIALNKAIIRGSDKCNTFSVDLLIIGLCPFCVGALRLIFNATTGLHSGVKGNLQILFILMHMIADNGFLLLLEAG